PRPEGVPAVPVAAGRRAGRAAAGRHRGEGRHGRRVDGGAAVARPRRRRSADRDRGRRPHRPGAPHRDHRAGGERRHVNDEDATRRRAALRTLLRRPLLTAEADPEDLVLVRRYQAELRDWLSRETGWRLQVDAETARLFKTAPTLDDGTHPARGKAGEPFGRRRYVVLCLALAVLERADAQTTLGRLAEEVLNAAAEPDLAFPFTLDSRAERADLVAVVRMLLSWGVLRRVSGDEESYLSATEDVLYDVRRAVLAALLTGTRGPSTVTAAGFEDRLAELTDEPVPDTDDLRNRALRQGLTRRLLDDPVVYYEDLDDAERAYLVSQRAAITRRIEEATGLVPELRAEGVAMVDPDDELTDVRMPEQRTDGHVTLLVA